MKKLILLLIACIGFAFVQAQTVTVPNTLSPSVTYQEVLTDYTLTNAVGRTFKWSVNQHYPCAQQFVVNMDSISGSLTNVLVTVWGQKSALKNDSTSIGTLNWKGTAAGGAPDTTGIITNDTENRYRTIYSTFKGTGTGTVKIDVQALKLYWPD